MHPRASLVTAASPVADVGLRPPSHRSLPAHGDPVSCRIRHRPDARNVPTFGREGRVVRRRGLGLNGLQAVLIGAVVLVVNGECHSSSSMTIAALLPAERIEFHAKFGAVSGRLIKQVVVLAPSPDVEMFGAADGFESQFARDFEDRTTDFSPRRDEKRCMDDARLAQVREIEIFWDGRLKQGPVDVVQTTASPRPAGIAPDWNYVKGAGRAERPFNVRPNRNDESALQPDHCLLGNMGAFRGSGDRGLHVASLLRSDSFGVLPCCDALLPELVRGTPQEGRRNPKHDREKGDDEGSKGDNELVVPLDNLDEQFGPGEKLRFAGLTLFIVFGPAIGLMLSVAGSRWRGLLWGGLTTLGLWFLWVAGLLGAGIWL